MSNFLNMSLVLLVVCALAAGSLAIVYGVTKEKIAAQALVERQNALQKVLPGADQFTEIEKDKHWEGTGTGVKAGDVFAAETNGYGGPINFVLGIDTERRVSGIMIITHSETPGLGAKITTKKFLEQFTGKSVGELWLVKDNPQTGKIDAITAATISSRVITKAIYQTIMTLPEKEAEN